MALSIISAIRRRAITRYKSANHEQSLTAIQRFASYSNHIMAASVISGVCKYRAFS